MRTDVDISGTAVPRFPRRELASEVRRYLRALRALGAFDFSVSEVSVAFVNDRTMRRLNATYRGRRRTTDVLTFAADRYDSPPGVSGRPLGEIVISIEQARRQARAERHALATEIRHLLLHGLIHSLGYDHETDDGEMVDLELRARDEVGLA